MEHKKEIFADGIGQIHFAGGMVRFDFVTLQQNDAAAGLPRRVQLDAAAHRQAARSRRPAEERAGQVKASRSRSLCCPSGVFRKGFFSVFESPESTIEKYFSSKRIIHQNP